MSHLDNYEWKEIRDGSWSINTKYVTEEDFDNDRCGECGSLLDGTGDRSGVIVYCPECHVTVAIH